MRFHFLKLHEDSFFSKNGSSFIKFDKLEHTILALSLFFVIAFFAPFLPSIGIFEASAFYEYFTVNPTGRSFAVRFIGILWEVKDGFSPEGFSWKDVAANELGIHIYQTLYMMEVV